MIKIKILNITKIVLFGLNIFIVCCVYSQEPKPTYLRGQLFFKVRQYAPIEIPNVDDIRKRTEDPVYQELNNLVTEYRITEIGKAFQLQDPKLEKIYTLIFTDTARTEQLINSLQQLPYIEYAERVPLYKAYLTPNDLHPNQWYFSTIQAESAWDISTGSASVVIAVVDDAVRITHEDLAANVWINPGEIPGNSIDDDNNGYIDDINGWDAADNDNDPNPVSPTNSSFTHGTHCSGIAAAATDNSTGIASISYNVKVMAVKTAKTGNGLLAYAYQGVSYAIAAGADIISMSWGSGSYSTTYQMLFDYANSQGIVLVAAAGNSNSSSPHYPASYNYVISVGATDSNDERASFSNYGSTIDVMAPGQSIWSTLAGSNSSYGYLNGTSMACPLVSGLAALMLSHDPSLSPEDLENCLKSGCDNIDAQNPSYIGQLGAGRINAYNTLLCLGAIKADFTVDYNQICPGVAVQFTDISINSPTSWQWSFSGGTPSTSTNPNPTITYNTGGAYDVTLIATNANGSDTITQTAYITVGLPAGTMSGTTTIVTGGNAQLKVDLIGKPPWSITYSDGTTLYNVNNITSTPNFITVSPTTTTTYTLTAVSDTDCAGTTSGSATITVIAAVSGCIQVKSFQKISDTQGNFIGILNNVDEFGIALDTIGDLDSDGILELVASAYWDDDGGTNRGAVWILFMNNDGTVNTQQKISDIQGNFTGTLDDNDSWGASVCALGDLDGDGIPDIAVGTHRDDDGGTDRGAVWILFLNTDGTVKSHQKISDIQGNFTGTLDNSDFFGLSVASLGDLDGDNIVDIAVGARWDDDGGTNRGAVWILFLNTDGTVKSHQKISDIQGSFTGTLDNEDRFGMHVEGIGDLDGDGINDITVSANYDDDGGTNKGAVWILFLNTDGTVKSYQKISDTQGNFTGILDDNDLFSQSVCTVGDLNNDGIVDIAVGAMGDDDGGTDRGAVWILFMNNDGTVKSYQKISNTQGNFTGILDDNDGFGNDLAYLGDWNGDGFSDLVVSAYLDDDGGTDRGAVWILFLEDTCAIIPAVDSCIQVKSFQKISDTQGNFTGILDNDDRFGTSVDTVGDLDSDGILELAVGAYYDDDGGTNRGAIWILFMNADGTVKSDQKISDIQGGFTGTLSNNDNFGISICSLGDLDGDGVSDIAVGAHYDDDGGSDKGAIWILFLNADGTVKSHQKISDIQAGFTGVLDNSDLFGQSVASLGDIDGDNIVDIAVGARWDDDGGIDRGAVWILFLNTDGTVKSHQKISDTQGGFTGILDNDDRFGTEVKGIEDLDGDGIVDLCVGVPRDDDGGTDRGAVWILFLNTDGTVKSHQKISDTQGGFTGILDNDDRLGRAISSIGDVSNDGIRDIVVSAFRDDDGGTDRGAVWILYLNTDGTVKSYQKISDTQGGFTGILDNDDHFGTNVVNIGDWDGNGLNDIAIGTSLDDDGGTDRGAVWILFLEDTCASDSCDIMASFTVSDTLACDSITLQFFNTSTNATQYEWQINGLFYSNSTDITITFNTTGTYTVTLIAVADSGSCRDTTSKSINIVAGLTASAWPDTTICAKDSAQLYSSSGIFHYWFPAKGLNDSLLPNPKASPDKSTTYRVVIIPAPGCDPDTAYVTVTIKDCETDIFIPNMFSPNGDGSNDYFRIYGSGFDELELMIYNRWGELVYYAQSVNEAVNNGWDGSYKGKLQPNGAFLWRIKGKFIDGSDISFNGSNTGTILLLR